MDLNETRKNIDRIDAELLKLISKRMELALKAKRLRDENCVGAKSDAERENEIIGNVRKHSHGIVTSDFSEKIFRELIEEAKHVQGKNLKLVGFQGEHGAFGEMAVAAFDKDTVPIPCLEFADVFEGVQSGQLDLGSVPVENSLEGSVNAVNDLLIEMNLQIIGEINLPVHHCLLALPNTDYREIKVIYSHPQALGQCRGFVARNKLEARPYYDTAGAAMMLANERPKAAAVIANRLCAEIYGLEVLKENVEDHQSNSTRFVVLAKADRVNAANGNKCSIAFTTPHRAGALFAVLKIFSDAEINLTRIESRPIRGERGKFAFLLDFQGSENNTKVADALKLAKEKTEMFKIIGCYKEAEL